MKSETESAMNPGDLRVARVKTRRALDLFIEVGYRLHASDTLWVPPPRPDLRKLLDRERHPFHQHAQVDYFLAFRGSRCVGRIAAIENYIHNKIHDEQIAFFGFLDAEPEPDIFAALLGRVEQWAAARGLKAVRGPCSFSTNEECGMLVEGFDSAPYLMTPWNPESYPPLVEAAGYRKEKDLYNYISNPHNYNRRIDRAADIVRQRFARKGEEVTTRTLRMEDFDNELAIVRRVYNSAWEKNWGFVPMTPAEIDEMAAELKRVVDPRLVIFCEVKGEPAAMALTLPDYNLALRHMEGKMGPKQIALFLMMKSNIRQVRVMAMGVRAEYRNRGLEALVMGETIRTCLDIGHGSAELGWILEDNVQINREMVNIGARRYKTLRIYQKDLQ